MDVLCEAFSGSNDFLGTSYFKSIELVLKDEEQARRYLTMDRWKSEDSFKEYVNANLAEFERLSRENDYLIFKKIYLGFFPLIFLFLQYPALASVFN